MTGGRRSSSIPGLAVATDWEEELASKLENGGLASDDLDEGDSGSFFVKNSDTDPSELAVEVGFGCPSEPTWDGELVNAYVDAVKEEKLKFYLTDWEDQLAGSAVLTLTDFIRGNLTKTHGPEVAEMVLAKLFKNETIFAITFGGASTMDHVKRYGMEFDKELRSMSVESPNWQDFCEKLEERLALLTLKFVSNVRVKDASKLD